MLQLLLKHHLIFYAILPFFGALISSLTFNIKASRNIAIFLSIVNLIISLIPNYNSALEYSLGGWDRYIGINFHIWNKSWLLISTMNFIFSFILIFGYKNLEDFLNSKYQQSKKHLIYSLLQLAQSGFLGILITQDFFTLYVFIEISSLSSYVLLSIGSDYKKSLITALDYLILGTIGATFILIAIGVILKNTGQLNMLIAQQNIVMTKAVQIAIAMYIAGALLKIAFFPIHSWMVNAYKNVFSILLMYIGSISSLAAGFLLYKLLYFFLSENPYQSLLIIKNFLYYFSGFVMIFFAYSAYIETNLRKILLFSSSMYAGYFVMLIATGIMSDILIYYLIVIAFIKLGLFYIISIIEKNNLEPNIKSITGIGLSSKVFSIFYTILILSNASLPFTSGFIGKILLLKELSLLGCYFGITTIVISSSIALLYNYKILIPIFQNFSVANSISLNLSEKFGLFIISILQILLIFLPNNLIHIKYDYSICYMHTYVFLYCMILFLIISIFSWVKNSYIRLIILIMTCIIYMCTIIFVAFNYYKYGWGNIYQIFHYKIYNFEFISFSIDQYSIIYLLLLSILWPISILYTNSYLKNISIESQENNNHSKFLFFINLCIISASFIAISGNLITMFGFYEVLSLSTIPLIIYNNSAISYKALYKYFKLLFIPSTLFFLLAIFLVYSYSHNISFVNDEGVFRVFKMNDLNILLILLLFILGISKIATFPFFSWLPASMVALHPVSAILHAVAVVNSGIFCLLKIIIYIFGIDYLSNIVILQYLMIIPIIVIIYASIVACYQSNIKQILAYSTITQMNIMLAGLLSFKMIGILGVLVHMISHSLAKLLLFFQAGDIYIFTKSNELKDLKGLSRKMPITYIIIFIGILVLSGIPFFPNFFSKKQIIHSIINSQIYSYQYFSYIIKATGFIGCVYLLRIICAMMGKNSNMITYHSSRIYSLPSYLLLILITIISIELSFYPDTVINHLNDLLIYCTIFILIFIILYKFNIEQMGRIKTPQFINSVILILKRFDRFFALYILNYINKSFTTIGNPSSLNSSLYALLGLFIIFSINILFLG